jgi:phenylacetate-CoA ligase
MKSDDTYTTRMNDLYAYRHLEFSTPDTLREVQRDRLCEHLTYCATRSPYYRKLFESARIQTETFTLDQISDLPFTAKSDIERNGDDFFAAPPSTIADISLSSGTTGLPTRIMYSENDLARLAYNEEKSFAACGVTSHDIVLLTCTMDRCFIAGLAYFLGIRNLGAAVVRNGLNSLESHAEVIGRMNPTVIVGVPTFVRKLGQHMDSTGTDPAGTTVSKIVCIGEPLRDESMERLPIADDLHNLWQADLFSTYASSEIQTTFCECAARQGGHLLPDLAITEIVDQQGSVLTPGNIGEVVVTPLAVEAMPLIRLKTGDLSFMIDQPCSCGRLSPRLGPILGRTNHMMKFRGTTLYPQAIYSVLDGIAGVGEYYVVAASESALSDRITVHASVNDSSCTAETIQTKLQARLRAKPDVLIHDEKAILQEVYAQHSRKPIRFIDRR